MKWHVINSIVRKKCGRSLWCILLIQLILIMHPLLCQVLEEGKLTDEDLARQGDYNEFSTLIQQILFLGSSYLKDI